MGFGDIFSSSFSLIREKITTCVAVRKEEAWKASVQAATAAAPVKAEPLLTTYEQVAKRENLPVLAADYVRSFRGPGVYPKDTTPQGGNCLSSACGRFCRCGGVAATPVWEDFLEEIPDCPKNRRLCGNLCRRHGGEGEQMAKRLIAGPTCPQCDGTGIEKPSDEVLLLRKMAARNRCMTGGLHIDIPDEVLLEGTSQWCFKERFLWGWLVPREEWVSAKVWMQAATIVLQSTNMAWPHPHRPREYISADNWYDLAASQKAVSAVFQWWRQQQFPQEDINFDAWWKEYVKPCCGFPTQEIEPRRKKRSYRESARIPPLGDFTLWEMCWAGLSNLDLYDPDAELFEDCIEDPFELEYLAQTTAPMMDLIMQEPEKSGRAVCRIIQARRQLGITEPLISKKTRKRRACVTLPPIAAELPKAMVSDFAASMYNAMRYLEPVMTCPHPDREEVEDQLDHLENKQGGEVISTPSFIKMLQDKKKEVRGKEFVGGSEGRVKRAEDFVLSKGDVFLANTLKEKLNRLGIVKKFSQQTGKQTKICVDLTNSEEVVRYPVKELTSSNERVLTAQTFTVLNRPQYKDLNKLAEHGWKEAKSVVLNLHVRSYVPVHSPIYAFCVIMWGHSSNAKLASLSGSYLYLGDEEATILQLPLLCGYIGKELEDFEAYKRSLVLSSVFYGPCGVGAGERMFGITAIEFTEYLPSSHAGITHEKDSWDAMLRSHGGMEKHATTPAICKSTSMRIKTFNQFRGSQIPVNYLGDFTGEALRDSAARASTSNVDAPRLAGGEKTLPESKSNPDECNARAGDEATSSEDKKGVSETPKEKVLELPKAVAPFKLAPMKEKAKREKVFATGFSNFLAIQRVALAKEISQGTVLATIDLLAKFRTTSTGVYNRWLSKGYLDTNVKVVSHLAPNKFSGLALWFCLDAYGKFPAALSASIDQELVSCFPCHLQVLSDPSSNTFVLDWDVLVGQTLFVGGDSFATPKLYIVAATSTTLAMSASGAFCVEFFSEGEERVRALATNANAVYPLPASALRRLDLYLPSVQMQVGEETWKSFPISFAKQRKGSSGYKSYSHAAAILSHFQGIGGILKARIIVTSSQFVTATLRVALWNSMLLPAEMARVPHVDTQTGISFALQIQDAFYASSVFGDSGAAIYVAPLSTAYAPEMCDSNFEYILHIEGIKPALPLCRTINYEQKFAWFAMSPKSTTTTLDLIINARNTDMVTTDLSVTNYVNPFALMCATTGMHWGKVLIHFSWTLNRGTKASEVEGSVTIAEGFGDKMDIFRGNVQEIGIYNTRAVVPLEFGTFAGPTPSRELTFKHCNWIRFNCPKANKISSLFVAVEVLPGFKFFGRTAGPFIGPPTVTANSNSHNKDLAVNSDSSGS
ncbi:polyprotein [Paris nepovirus 1]|uniref:Polyprotein n=1 Tax=Paris nepovirus 1 TaxID=3002895 RepID=A0AAF0A1Z4_9SECO|nr:polyprotein [Paris nepovirus 1]